MEILHLNIFQILIYIDPGSGSLLFQALLSGLLTIMAFYKRIIAYFKSRFTKKKAEDLDELEES